MTEKAQMFLLRVDGLVAAENVPFAQLASLLAKYGVVQDSTVNRLMEGQRERVLGQELEISRQSSEIEPRLYTLHVDGKVAKTNVPDAELANLLESYGARRKDLSRALVAGKTQRVLGQNLKLSRQQSAQTAPVIEDRELAAIAANAKQEGPKAHRAKSESPLPARAPTTFDAPLQELINRAKKLRKGTLMFGGAALALAVLGGIFYALGVAAEPTTAIDQILVPDAITLAFPSASSADSDHMGLPGIESTLSSLFNSTLVSVLSGVVMLVGVGAAVITRRYSHVIPAMIIGTIPTVLGTYVDFIETGTPSEPSEFYSAVKSKDLPVLQHLLGSRQDLDEVAKAYVLAQASIADGRASKWVGLTAKNLREGKIKDRFAVPAGVAYAIEATELGPESPYLSEQAVQHREKTLAKASDRKRISFWTLLLAGLFGLTASGHESIAQIIFRRVRRISKLLDPVLSSFIHPRR